MACLTQQKLALFFGHLVKFNKSNDDGEPNTDEPAPACTLCHRFQVPALQELHFDEDAEIVKEPIAQEAESGQDLQFLLLIRNFLRANLLDLDILVEELEKTEKSPGYTHVICTR